MKDALTVSDRDQASAKASYQVSGAGVSSHFLPIDFTAQWLPIRAPLGRPERRVPGDCCHRRGRIAVYCPTSDHAANMEKAETTIAPRPSRKWRTKTHKDTTTLLVTMATG
jgi:prolyl-tRNA synthetase